MKKSLLRIQDLSVRAFGKELLSQINLEIHQGERHVIMGPNGAGKSTLANLLAGHPDYEVTRGEITMDGVHIMQLTPEQRAHHGIFLSFQHPVELPGISNKTFLRESYRAICRSRGLEPVSDEAFEQLIVQTMERLHLPVEMKYRDVNVGFSGGEKKRSEILQMLLLDPKMAILDEIDSGVDIDGLKLIAAAINAFSGPTKGLLMITHYQRLLHYVKPDYVHVIMGGTIVRSGGADLGQWIEERGYAGIRGEESGDRS